jgi:hypothetical protein
MVTGKDLQHDLPGEDWPATHARQPGVDCNVPPLAFFEEAYTNETLLEKFRTDKKLVHQVRLLRGTQDGQGREKIAVTQLSLYDIVCLSATVTGCIFEVVVEQLRFRR